MSETRDKTLAKYWHRWELGLVALLLVTSIVGVCWAEFKGQPRLIETHPRR